jgi:hypothetical protein
VIRCQRHSPALSVAALHGAGDWSFAKRPPRLGADRAPDRREPEAELERLVRAAAPTRRVLCALAARAVEVRSWSRLGFARAGDQMRERQGISARSLQELARLHRFLAEAPGVDAAFQAGRIGWTAARALARLGSIDDETLWLRRTKALSLPGPGASGAPGARGVRGADAEPGPGRGRAAAGSPSGGLYAARAREVAARPRAGAPRGGRVPPELGVCGGGGGRGERRGAPR